MNRRKFLATVGMTTGAIAFATPMFGEQAHRDGWEDFELDVVAFYRDNKYGLVPSMYNLLGLHGHIHKIDAGLIPFAPSLLCAPLLAAYLIDNKIDSLRIDPLIAADEMANFATITEFIAKKYGRSVPNVLGFECGCVCRELSDTEEFRRLSLADKDEMRSGWPVGQSFYQRVIFPVMAGRPFSECNRYTLRNGTLQFKPYNYLLDF